MSAYRRIAGVIVTLSLDIHFKNAVTLKTELCVRRGHWKCHCSIARLSLLIDVLL